MADLIIKYSASSDLYTLLDASYQAMFSGHTYDVATTKGTMTFVSGIYTIPAKTFKNISDTITSIDIPNGIVSFGASAFSGCGSIAEVTLPSSITSIAHDAFNNVYVTTLTCTSTIPPVLDPSQTSFSISEMYIPESALSAYQNSTWATFVSEFKLIPEPSPRPHRGYGFNTDGMIDADYLWELGNPVVINQ